jgi:hypothetical protein
MKTSGAILGAILALSVAVWVLVYFLTPGDQLTQAETLVIVGVCGTGVLVIRWFWSCIARARGRHVEKS